jgi:mRNA interferase MazF
VIVTPDALMSKLDDVLCLFISLAMPPEILPTDFILEISHPGFAQTGLKYRSVFRTHKIALIHKSLVERTLGVASQSIAAELDRRLKIALGL